MQEKYQKERPILDKHNSFFDEVKIRENNSVSKIEFIKKSSESEYLFLDQLNILESENKRINLQATVTKVRKQGGVSFVILEGSDQTKKLQTVVETPKGEMREMFGSLSIKKGSIIRIKGELVKKREETIEKEKAVENNLENYELMSKPIDINVLSRPEIPSMELDWKDVMKGGHINSKDYGEVIRMPEFRRILYMRESLKRTFIEHFNNRGFKTIDVSSLTGSISESGAEVFRVESRAGELSLIQSPQQIKQIMAGFLNKVVWVGQAFRNDPSITAHHLAEFTGMDAEMQIQTENKKDGMNIIMYELQESVRSLINDISKHEKCFKENNAEPPKILEEGIPVISFSEAIKIAETDQFNRDAEKKVANYIKDKTNSEFYFITNFPDDEKPFYTDVMEDNQDYTYSFDLIYRGVEISSGGLRVNDVILLKERLIKKGYNPSNFIDYLDNFARGTAQTGGFGIGLERFIAGSLGGINVRLTIPFPKTSELILG